MAAENGNGNGAPAYDEDGEEEWDGEYDEDDEDDIEEHAAEIARRIEAQLMADIEANPATSSAEPSEPPTKEEAATVATVRNILAMLEHDTVAKGAFGVTQVPGYDTLLAVFHKIASSGRVPSGSALAVSRAVVTMAKSDTLFGGLRHSEAPTTLLKRKRDTPTNEEPASKRARAPHPIHAALATAVRIISYSIPAGRKLDPSLVLSIKSHLLAVFRFACSIAPSQMSQKSRDALTEVSGFLQVIGVLNGIQFDDPTTKNDPTVVDTAVYPCLSDGCRGNKFFVRHNGLRGHERLVHKKPTGTTQAVFKCEGCEKAFPTREVAQQHKDAAEADSRCGKAQIVETTITLITEPPLPPLTDADREEIDPTALGETILLVLGLHSLLQVQVARALGAPVPGAQIPPVNGNAAMGRFVAGPSTASAPRSASAASEEPAGATATATPKEQVEEDEEMTDDASASASHSVKPTPPPAA
ncbi:hypothetical protein C8F01DRAFT_164775 [Mycena amicta]|nr:hypothetical protein C8F01DRAFT_164775 [Mycena amicta]